jgi:hypothetical protein
MEAKPPIEAQVIRDVRATTTAFFAASGFGRDCVS